MRNLRQQVEQPQSDSTTTFIYALIDPRTGFVRYVGKANNLLKRFRLHLLPAELEKNTHKAHWLKELLYDRFKPIQTLLEEVPKQEWPIAEKKWIAYYRSIPDYPALTNSTDGGEGTEGYAHSKETRQKLSVPKTWKTRLRLSIGQANRWKKSPEEVRQKNLKNLRTPWSDEKKAKRSNDARNSSRPADASSQYRNVTKWERGNAWSKQWRAGCIIGGKQICIGFFFTEEEAARARDRYFLKNIGEDVILNFPRGEYPLDPNEIVVIENTKPARAQVVMKNSSGYMGVAKNGKNGWSACISCNGVRYRLGTHRTPEEAARRYDIKAIELYGDFARTNFARSSYD